VLDEFRPDVVHVGHLNHLSITIVSTAANRGIPVVFTLHDHWLACPRGQLIQTFPDDPEDMWTLCEGWEPEKCAVHCYSRHFTGSTDNRAADMDYWSAWVRRRMADVGEVVEHVDRFISPSKCVGERFQSTFDVPVTKLLYVDYGFHIDRLQGRERQHEDEFVFGYIGTHIHAKGVDDLIRAFALLRGACRLRIWGWSTDDTASLKAMADALPPDVRSRVEFLGGYKNSEIVPQVFNRLDAVVVPSRWSENSPLVIHEAQQARVPVVTADAGGMAEYVRHEENGLLFRHRDARDIARMMQRLVDNPALACSLGARGYLHSESGDVLSMGEHASVVEGVYTEVIERRRKASVPVLDGPWRVTLDTNPDDCNLSCIMCEEHSRYSPKKANRLSEGHPPRRMSMTTVRSVIEELAGNGLREVIPSTMGEPLLYRGMEEIIELCVRHRVKLNLTTNGTFPRLGARRWAELVVPIGSDVKISLNGVRQETQVKVMPGAKLGRTLANTREFIEVRDAHATAGGNRCSVTFQMTFMEMNYRELPDLVRLAASMGVDRVKGHHVWVNFPELEDESLRRSPESMAKWNAIVDEARATAVETRLPAGREVRLDGIFELDAGGSETITSDGVCPFLGREAWVNTEGRFAPCCAPDDLRKTLGAFGNGVDAGLTAIWRGSRYQSLCRTYMNRALCIRCGMRRPVG